MNISMHALHRMEKRKIPPETVMAAIAHGKKTPTTDPERIRHIMGDVGVVTTKDMSVIITVFHVFQRFKPVETPRYRHESPHEKRARIQHKQRKEELKWQ